MSDNRAPLHMPAPRDHADPSVSELMPFRSTKINLKKSPILYFLIILALTVPLMFSAFYSIIGAKSDPETTGNIKYFALLMTGVICAMLQAMVFVYARTQRSFFHYWFAFVAVAAILVSPLISVFFYVFHSLWPFYRPDATTFLPSFLSNFSSAGLMEELIKAVPTLLGAWLGYRMTTNPALEQQPVARFIAVRGPLDGALMGVFAGGGFTVIETGIQYVLNEAVRISQLANSAEAGIAAGFILLIPRALGAAVGHMAYAGIFGYFIGLTVLKPRHVWKLLAIGWISAATVHALWNAAGTISPLLFHAVAGIAAIGLASVLLKARQLEQARTGMAAESFGSIVVDRRPPTGIQAQPAPVAQQALPAATAIPIVAQALVLEVDGLQIALRPDSTLDLGAEPALGGRGAGVTGVVVPHPSRANVLGLRNTGGVAWTARLRDGSQQQIEREQNIRLAPGVTIAFGGGLIGSVAKVG